MRWHMLASVVIVTKVVLGCAASTDGQVPGSCNLSCSEPKVPAGEYEIVPLMPEDTESIDVFCTAPFRAENNSVLPYNKPIQVKYYVYELVPPFGHRTYDPRTDPEGIPPPNTEGATPGLLERVPKGGVGFEPLLFGVMATEKTNKEHLDGPTVSSGKFDGVVTPKSEWCSDSCGVMTYEFWPACVEGVENTVVAGIAAGGAFVKNVWRFSLGGGG